MLRLACGIEVHEGMATEEFLAIPEVRALIHRRAYSHSLLVYEYQCGLSGSSDIAAEMAADDYMLEKIQARSEAIHAVRACGRRRAERELEERVTREIFDLVWVGMEGETDFLEEGLLGPGWSYLPPGREPHRAADCLDCHEPGASACNACHHVVFEA